MKDIIKFYQFLGKYKWKMALFLPVLAGSVILETIRPFWLKGILDSATWGNHNGTIMYLVLFGVSTIGSNLLSTWSYYLGDKVMSFLIADIRDEVFQKIMDLDFAYHVEKNTGSLISAFRRGESAVFSMFVSIHQELFRVLVALIVTLFFLFSLSPLMAWLLLILFITNVLLIWWLVKVNLKYRSIFNKSEDEIAGLISDNMINYETVKFFAAEKRERKRLELSTNLWLQRFWKYANSFRLMDITIGTTSGGGMIFILYLAVNKLGNGFTLGDLVMVAGFVTAFYYQFFNLFMKLRDIAKNIADLEKYLGILDNEIKVLDPIKSKKIDKSKGKVEFKNIGFVYPKNQEKILEDINLTIEAGQRVALVGRSGAGKTTLVKLLLRFYDPSNGTIEVNGVDIKKISKATLRSMISVVPQEPIMFNNSVKFNLAYGKEKVTMDEVKLAAKRANILEFIEGLPNKWETQVGERGIKLSGGQKQRLAIARCFLADPKILIFDEATSNLDSESEKKIQMALTEISKNRTVIIIAHRFSILRGADKIVVLSGGTIVEEGNHDELLAKGGLYKMLWTLQTKGKLTDSESDDKIAPDLTLGNRI